MAYESEVKIINAWNPGAIGNHEVLPAIAGKAYRIKSAVLTLYSEAGKIGSLVQLVGYNRDGVANVLCRAVVEPGVASAVNVPIAPLDFVTKPGTKVYIHCYDKTMAACQFTDFISAGVAISYTEIN